MLSVSPRVVHLVGADVSAGRLVALRAILAQGEVLARQRVMQVGAAGPAASGLEHPISVRAPLGIGRLRARALRRSLRGLIAGSNQAGVYDLCAEPCILHVWSPIALDWCASFQRFAPIAPPHVALIELEWGGDLRRVARDCTVDWGARRYFSCASERLRNKLVGFGVAAERCACVPDFVDAREIERARGLKLRARLGLTHEHKVVVALPPVSRAAGTFIAAWATLLLRRVRPDLRLVVSAGGEEQSRVKRLAQSCRDEQVVRFPPTDWTLAQLASLADLVLFLPRQDAPTFGLAWAMAAGCPIVATRTPCVSEWATDGRSAWLCQPGDPKDAARMMLLALEQPEESSRRAAEARTTALVKFDRQAVLASYARLYRELAGGAGSEFAEAANGVDYVAAEPAT